MQAQDNLWIRYHGKKDLSIHFKATANLIGFLADFQAKLQAYSYSISVGSKICSFAAARLINFTSLCKRFTVAYVALGKRIVGWCKVLKNEDFTLFFS